MKITYTLVGSRVVTAIGVLAYKTTQVTVNFDPSLREVTSLQFAVHDLPETQESPNGELEELRKLKTVTRKWLAGEGGSLRDVLEAYDLLPEPDDDDRDSYPDPDWEREP